METTAPRADNSTSCLHILKKNKTLTIIILIRLIITWTYSLPVVTEVKLLTYTEPFRFLWPWLADRMSKIVC